MGAIGALAEEARELLEGGDAPGLGEALAAGQAMLEELGAVPSPLAERIAALQASPAVHGARLSGAGGGDCVVVLARDAGAAAAAMADCGLDVLDLEPEAEGLRIEEKTK